MSPETRNRQDCIVNSADVRWAYRYYLGREIENNDMVASYVDNRVTRGRLRTALINSAEYNALFHAKPLRDEFCVYTPSGRKFVVLGNCQAPNIARALSETVCDSVFGVDVLTTKIPRVVLDDEISLADVVISCHLSADFGLFSTENMRARSLANYYVYSPMYFSGLHPDITYWGSRSERVLSPLGGYHSKIVLRSFLRGLSVQRCLSEFNGSVYSSLGYFNEVETSLSELEAREAKCDIKIANALKSTFREKSLFLTVNHPTPMGISVLVTEIVKRLGLLSDRRVRQTTYSSLWQNAIWPVYPEIGDKNGVQFACSRSFWTNGVVLGLEEFITRSYYRYGEMGAERLEMLAAPDHLAGLMLDR